MHLIKNQNIGVIKINLNRDKYLNVLEINIYLIVIVVMSLKEDLILLQDWIHGVHIVLIHLNYYVIMMTVLNVLKNLLHLMTKQNIGVVKMN